MPVLNRTHHLPRNKKYGNPRDLPTAQYIVVKPVENLHVAGVQIAEGMTVTLTEAAARHWLREGVIEAVPAETPDPSPGETPDPSPEA
jgi:hypothetical protein